MAVIAIFSGSYCGGDDIASGIAEKLGYDYIENEILEKTAKKHSIQVSKLEKTLHGPTPFFNRLTREREKFAAYLQTTLAEEIQKDNLVVHGFNTLLLPDTIPHVLRVCIIADLKYRVNNAVKTDRISEKDADNLIRKFDSKSFQWSQFVKGLSPWDEELYDILYPMQDSSVEQAVENIIKNAQKDAVKTTDKSKTAARDFLLASQVNEVLIDKYSNLEVECADGHVTVLINKFIQRLEQRKKEIEETAVTVPDIKEITVKVGPKFHVPSIYPTDNFELPQKVLLVDDEKEFVHTLSERLQSRSLESAVVYDGEEALDFVEGEEPEVMVLDLKMPGIDGIEVLRKVKQSHPNVEVIILTGHGSDREQQLAEDLGAFAYLQKPVDIDKLSDTMKQAYKKIKDSQDSR